MKRNARVISICLLLMLTVILLPGCRSGKETSAGEFDYKTADLGSEPVTLNLYMDQGSSAGLFDLSEAFQNEFANATVAVSSMNASDMLVNLENNDNDIDMMMITFSQRIWHETYASAWAKNCIDFRQNTWVDMSALNETLLDSLTLDGAVYALPLCTESVGLITNMDLLKKCGVETAPKTTQEFLDACAAVKAAGCQPLRCKDISLTYLLSGMIDCEIAADKTSDKFTEAVMTADSSAADYFTSCADLLYTMQQNGYIDTESLVYIPEAETNGAAENQPMTTYMQECYAFLAGDVAFFPAYPDLLSSLQKREARLESYAENPFKYEVIPIPTKYGPAPVRTSGYVLLVNKNSKNLEWAKKFVQYVYWRDSAEEVGNVSIFSDAQFAMSPYDTDKVHTKLGEKYYPAYYAAFADGAACPAEIPAILKYNGCGMCMGVIKRGLDASLEDGGTTILQAAAVSADSAKEAFVEACRSWFIEGNVYIP